MRKWIGVIATILWMGSGFADSSYLDAQITENQYSVIYIEKEAVSREEARSSALTRAAELTKEKGYRYFVVDAEEEVMVAQTEANPDPFPGNLYQEEIVEDNFGRQALQNNTPQPTQLYKGLKVKITCYKEMPDTPMAIDACQLIKCE